MSGSKVIETLISSFIVKGYFNESRFGSYAWVSFNVEITVELEKMYLKQYKFEVEAQLYNPLINNIQSYDKEGEQQRYVAMPFSLN